MILTETERDQLAEAQQELESIRSQAYAADRVAAATRARDDLVVRVHGQHKATRGIIVELAAALSTHRETPVGRSTVHRILLHAVTGRHAYRAASTRKRKTAKETTS